MRQFFFSGTTEKHKQRSSIEDNKNEHCDYWMSVAPSPWHLVRHVSIQVTGPPLSLMLCSLSCFICHSVWVGQTHSKCYFYSPWYGSNWGGMLTAWTLHWHWACGRYQVLFSTITNPSSLKDQSSWNYVPPFWLQSISSTVVSSETPADHVRKIKRNAQIW